MCLIRGENHGGVHGTARALPRFDAVGHRMAVVVDGHEGEIGELIVEQEAGTMMREPKACSMVVVMETALPFLSTIEIWLVPMPSMVRSCP